MSKEGRLKEVLEAGWNEDVEIDNEEEVAGRTIKECSSKPPPQVRHHVAASFLVSVGGKSLKASSWQAAATI